MSNQNTTQKLDLKEINFDSDEEKHFAWYLDELQRAEYILKWAYQPYTYRLSPIQKYSVYEQLKTKIKNKRLSLLQSHEYTPDFGVVFAEKAHHLFYRGIFEGLDLRNIPFIANSDNAIKHTPYSIIEIKPAYDKHNMIRLFRINQKWLYANMGIYIQEITVNKGNSRGLFPDTFTPHNYLFTPTGRDKKVRYKPRSLQEYVSLCQ